MRAISLIFTVFIISYTHFLQAREGFRPDHLSRILNVAEVAVSDNGRYVAYTLLIPIEMQDKIGGTFYRELYLYDDSNGNTTPLITGSVSVSGIDWVPGRDEVTYRQVAEGGRGLQVFSMGVKDKAVKQLTNFPGGVRNYRFIDHNTLAFTSTAPHNNHKQRMLRQGIDLYIYEEEMRHIELYRYNIHSEESIRLVEGLTVFDFEVSPDGKKIAAAIAEQNLIDHEYMFKRIHILDAESGKVLKTMNNPGKLQTMQWCPESRRLVFRSGAGIEDSVCGSLYIMDTENGNEQFEDLENLVSGLELSVIDVIWEDKDNLLYVSEESVDITVTRYNLKKRSHKTVVPGGLAVFRSIQTKEEHLYLAGNTWRHPNELMQFDLKKGTLSKVSQHNDDWLAEVSFAQQEKISYTARDGHRIDGVLLYPLNYKEGEAYPLIVYIHGGPEACVKNGWNNGYSQWGQFAAARGFFVFSPNYRASSGRGYAFSMAGYADLLGVEYDDVLDGIDHLIAAGLVDKGRVGIGGGSYGGFFAAYSATKHTDRFAASVVFVGIANQVSKRKTTDIPLEDYHVHWGFWTHEDHNKVWNASPVQFAHMSKTPTLILHGDDDPRIPVSQGLELYRALKLHGKAPVRFVRYPGEGHGNIKNVNRHDYLVRTLDWFGYYLITNTGSGEMPPRYIDYPIH